MQAISKDLLRSKLVWLFVLFTVAYVSLSLLAPADKVAMAKYHLNAGQLKTLSLTIVMPYVIIWSVALVGYLRLRNYAVMINKSKDGQAFHMIASGILWFALWLPISAIATVLFSDYYTVHPVATAGLTRLENYVNLVVLVPGFVLTYFGTKKLMPIIKRPTFSPSQLLVFVYLALAVLYVWLALHDVNRQVAMAGVARATYYEPDWLIVITLIIPRLLLWFIGVQAVYNLYLYSKNVKGSLYRIALRWLTIGLGGIVALVVALRCLQSLSTTLASFSLALLLVLIYLLLIMMSVGYALVAKGARALQRLEEL